MFGTLIICMVIGVPVALSLGCASVVGLINDGSVPLIVLGQRIYAANDSFPLLAIPFFMFAGAVLTQGGISKRLVNFAQCLIGSVTGGLAMVATVAAMFFAAISGSSAATTAAIGGSLIVAMKEKGYSRDFSAAAIAAAGTTGVVIPPSTPMVVYGVVTGASIGALFLGGIIPGLLMGFSMMAVNYFLAKKGGYTGIPRVSLKVAWASFTDAVWGILMPIIILGGIYGGIFTPTESAAVASVYGLLVGIFVYKEVKVSDIFRIAKTAVISSALVMFILSTANLFSWMMIMANVPQRLAMALSNFTTDPVIIMMMINIFLLFLGTFLTASAAISIVAPIFFPLITAVGVDPVAFGVIMVVNLAIGCITPPVGVDLFVAQTIAGISLERISKAVFPYILVLIASLALITIFPQLILFLPNLAK